MSPSLEVLYPIAERQGGYLTASQARNLGVSHQQLYYLSRSGSIERVAHGIYRLKRFPSQPFEDVIVATLWAGEGAVASHETALAVYGLTDAMPPVIHVTVQGRFRGRKRGVVVHSAPIGRGERSTRSGVPVLRQTFELRQTRWPPQLRPPPPDWETSWFVYVEEHGVPWSDLEEAYNALGKLMQPLLDGDAQPGAAWNSAAWQWI